MSRPEKTSSKKFLIAALVVFAVLASIYTLKNLPYTPDTPVPREAPKPPAVLKTQDTVPVQKEAPVAAVKIDRTPPAKEIKKPLSVDKPLPRSAKIEAAKQPPPAPSPVPVPTKLLPKEKKPVVIVQKKIEPKPAVSEKTPVVIDQKKVEAKPTLSDVTTTGAEKTAHREQQYPEDPAPGMATVKVVNLRSGESVALADIPAGKACVDDDYKKLFVITGNEIKSYNFNAVSLNQKETYRFGGTTDAGDEKKSDNAVSRLKRYWRLKIPEDEVTAFAGGHDGRSLYVGDRKGYVHFFDTSRRHYWGKLAFLRKPVLMIKPLKDESLLIFYRDGDVVLAKRYRSPVLSSLQLLKDSYQLAATVRFPYQQCNSVDVAQTGEKAVFICDRKNIVVLDIPSMAIQKKIEGRKFVNFANFIGNEYLMYSDVRHLSEADTPFDATLRDEMVKFFDWRNSVATPGRGNLFVKISNKNNLNLYSFSKMASSGKSGAIFGASGELIEGVHETSHVSFGEDGNTVFVLNAAKNRLSVYKL
jgi:hypothetical protein